MSGSNGIGDHWFESSLGETRDKAKAVEIPLVAFPIPKLYPLLRIKAGSKALGYHAKTSESKSLSSLEIGTGRRSLVISRKDKAEHHIFIRPLVFSLTGRMGKGYPVKVEVVGSSPTDHLRVIVAQLVER